MSGFDLSAAKKAESGNNNDDEATTTGSDEEEIPFERNESTEGYFLFCESSSLVTEISEKVFGNEAAYNFASWGDDLSDLEEAGTLEDYAGTSLNGQQKLDLLHLLVKGTFGGRQSDLNEGYGMGWDKDESPPAIYDNDEVDHVPYFDVYPEVSAFDHETLGGDEVAQLEAEGLDMDDFGSLERTIGPMLPKINGERVPILFEGNNEVEKMIDMLDTIDFEEVTYCPENGSLQGTPTLGPEDEDSEVSSDNPGEDEVEADEVDKADDEDLDLAANPERVVEAKVTDLKSGENSVTNITSERTIKTMLRAEKDGENRDSAVDRLEQRLRAIQSSDDDDEADEDDSEEVEQASDDEEPEPVEDSDEGGLSDVDKTLINTLMDKEDYSWEEAKAEVVGE